MFKGGHVLKALNQTKITKNVCLLVDFCCSYIVYSVKVRIVKVTVLSFLS